MSHFLSHTACLRSPLSVGNETVIGVTATLGYARVSTTGQDLDAQLAALTAAGVEADRVFTDKLSGSAKTDRPGLAAMLDYARAGDAVVVAAIDRLGRSVAEVTRTIADLGERRIILRALRESIDTATPTGRAIAAIMATLARARTRTRPRAPRRISRISPSTRLAGHQAGQADRRSTRTAASARGYRGTSPRTRYSVRDWASDRVPLPHSVEVGRSSHGSLIVSGSG